MCSCISTVAGVILHLPGAITAPDRQTHKTSDFQKADALRCETQLPDDCKGRQNTPMPCGLRFSLPNSLIISK